MPVDVGLEKPRVYLHPYQHSRGFLLGSFIADGEIMIRATSISRAAFHNV